MSSTALSRRSFLRGRLNGHVDILPPPWAGAVDDFLNQCTRCDSCIAACPEKIITRGSGGFPSIDFNQGECSFCAHCVDVCQPKALDKHKSEKPWDLIALIQEDCLAKKAVVCRTCSEFCEADAIDFIWSLEYGNKVAIPQVKAEDCTGCGACVSSCPSRSIQVTPNRPVHDKSVNAKKQELSV